MIPNQKNLCGIGGKAKAKADCSDGLLLLKYTLALELCSGKDDDGLINHGHKSQVPSSSQW